MATKWLITGGCGFIGTTLINQLRGLEGHHVRVIDSLQTGTLADLEAVTPVVQIPADAPGPMNERDETELVTGNILDAALAEKVVQGADVIVHLAANTGVQPSIESPMDDMQANVVGIVNYLEAARKAGVPSFIFASSGAPIGNATPPIKEDICCRPISPYGASKLAGEAYCSAYHGSYGMNTIALRFSNVYGPLSTHKGSVVAKFINRVFAGDNWVVNGNGEQTRDFIYSEDLTRAIIRAVESGLGGEVFQIASGREVSINELVTMLQAAMRKAGLEAPEVQFGTPLKGDVMRNFADITKVKNTLGWSPSMGLEEGLDTTIAWFVDHYKKG